MENLKVALVTTTTGKQYISMNIHTDGDAVLLDFYRDAYSVSILEAKKACEILGIDYKKFLEKQSKDQYNELQMMIDLYGSGLEVMAAKEKLRNINLSLQNT